MPNERTSKLKATVVSVWYVYLGIAFFIATPFYNWQFAHENGFAAWIALGEVVPTLKATVWPVSICYDRHQAGVDASAKAAVMSYAHEMQAAKDVAMKGAEQLPTDELQDKKLSRTQRIAVVKSYYQTTKDRQDGYITSISRIKPPEELRDFHRAVIAEARGYVAFIDRARDIILKSDQAAAATQHADLQKFRTEARAIVAAAAEKAGVKGWQSLLLYGPPDSQ